MKNKVKTLKFKKKMKKLKFLAFFKFKKKKKNKVKLLLKKGKYNTKYSRKKNK